jgi:hypothetical protein
MSTLERMPRHYMFSSDEESSSDSDDAPQDEDEEGGNPIDDALETPLPLPQAINRLGMVHSLFMDKEEDESADVGDEWEKVVSRRLEDR